MQWFRHLGFKKCKFCNKNILIVYHWLNGNSVIKDGKINTAAARDTFSETIEEKGVDIETHVSMLGVLSSISTQLLELLVSKRLHIRPPPLGIQSQ